MQIILSREVYSLKLFQNMAVIDNGAFWSKYESKSNHLVNTWLIGKNITLNFIKDRCSTFN